MWLAQFVCAPQFFKTPSALCGHTVHQIRSKAHNKYNHNACCNRTNSVRGNFDDSRRLGNNHKNSEVSSLLNEQNITRRLKRKKPFELVKQQTTKWFSGSDLVIRNLK
jgi:hypothetical protein